MSRKTLLLIIGLSGLLLSTWILAGAPVQGDSNSHSEDASPAVVTSPTLDLLALNVAHGRGSALNQLLVTESSHQKNLDDIAALISSSGAHIVALQEADGPSLWSGGFDHVEYLSGATGYTSLIHGYHANSWLYAYGAALISPVRLLDTGSAQFESSWPTATKGYVRGDISWRNSESQDNIRRITVVSVHLDFSRKAVRQAQIAQLADELAAISNPLIVLGDFNADWSQAESPVRILARELGLHAFDPVAEGLGTYKGSERLDWVLISDELVFVDYTVLPDIVSDHLALLTRIAWDIGK